MNQCNYCTCRKPNIFKPQPDIKQHKDCRNGNRNDRIHTHLGAYGRTDVLVVLAFYVIARISVGNTFIACMLTIVGYSINATIVIFDRIREEMKTKKRTEELDTLVNRCITRTLTRSIYTSLTTFVMVAVLFVMGVSSIKEFALPLMVGIICGAYSSVCITGALWYVMKTKIVKKAESAKAGTSKKKK